MFILYTKSIDVIRDAQIEKRALVIRFLDSALITFVIVEIH